MAEKRKRAQRAGNFTNNEKEILTELVMKYKNKIENKKSDSATNVEKINGWKSLAREFNSISGYCQRTPGNLKTCWENVKRHSKKESATRKRELFKTGGGRPTPSSNTGMKNIVEAILGPALEGLENLYDGDDALLDRNGKEKEDTIPHQVTIPSKSQFVTLVNSESELYDNEEVVQIVQIMENTSPIAGTSFEAEKTTCSKEDDVNWEGWTPNSLRKPVSDPLSRDSTWQKRRRPVKSTNLADELVVEKINLVKTLIKNAEAESQRKIQILDEQLKQEQIKTQKMLQ